MIYAEKHLSLLSRMGAMGCSCVSLENFQKKYWIRPVKKSKIWVCKSRFARKKPRKSRGN